MARFCYTGRSASVQTRHCRELAGAGFSQHSTIYFVAHPWKGNINMASSERQRELRRRRKRKKQVARIKRIAEKASASDKLGLAAKLRNLTPGAETLITALDLEQR